MLRGGYNFTLHFNNSIGALKEGRGSNWTTGVPADGQRLLDLARSVPNTELNFGTLSSGNTDENGCDPAWQSPQKASKIAQFCS